MPSTVCGGVVWGVCAGGVRVEPVLVPVQPDDGVSTHPATPAVVHPSTCATRIYPSFGLISSEHQVMFGQIQGIDLAIRMMK